MPSFEAADNTSATDPDVVAPYLLWDLTPDAGSSVNLTLDKISGSIYAPGVDLTLSQSSPFEGTVISETIAATQGSGELHHYPFGGTITCEERDADAYSHSYADAVDLQCNAAESVSDHPDGRFARACYR